MNDGSRQELTNAFQTGASRNDRTKLSLDFTQTPKKTDNQNNPCFLDSPDMQMLKIPSPELEKMILDNYTINTGSTTPTPTQFVNPKAITRMDPSYGAANVPDNLYVDISSGPVNDLQQPMSAVSIPNQRNIIISQGIPQYITSAPIVMNPNCHHPNTSNSNFLLSNIIPVPPKVTSIADPRYVMSAPSTQVSMHQSINRIPQQPQQMMVQNVVNPPCTLSASTSYLSNIDQFSNSNSPVSVKTEPGNLSSSESVPSTAEQSPVPMNVSGNPTMQDQIKQERKRLRNRIAATKCRKRKLEKISTLEDQVKELKKSNFDLSERKHQLREQIANLKQKMMIHLKHGCQVHVQNMEAFNAT